MITWRPAAIVGCATAVLALVGLVLGDGAWPWVLAGVIILVVAGLVLADIALAAPLSDVRLRREGDTAIWLGQSATVTLIVDNHSQRLLRAQIRDAWFPSAQAEPYSQDRVLSPGTATRIVTTLHPTRRGDNRAVRVIIRSSGPMGLGFRQTTHHMAATMTPPWTLRVYPPFSSRRFLPEKMARLRVLEGATVTRGRGQGTEFDALREYVIGDDVRSIDWRASARRSEVVVRTWRPERDRHVLCVLDTGRTSAARIGDEPRLDAAIDAALLLATLASRADDKVDLLAIDTAVRASVTAGRHATLPRLVSALAPLSPALVETDFELVTGEILRRARKRALVVLFTALEPGAVGEGLLPVLPRLAARHKVVIAAVHDPELTRLAAAPGSPDATAADAYTAAAATRALAERDRVRAVLARQGVEVVDAPTDVFASHIADAYLTMKATGRL